MTPIKQSLLRIVPILLFQFLNPTVICADNNNIPAPRSYEIMLNPELNKEAGAVDLYSIYSLVSSYNQMGYDAIKCEPNESTPSQASVKCKANRLIRLLKAFTLDSFISKYFIITQHEVFGHGSWDREINKTYDGISKVNTAFYPGLGLGFPFINLISISGSYTVKPHSHWYTRNELIELDTAGVESTQVMADVIVEQMTMNHQVDYYSARLQLDARGDLFWYLLTLSEPQRSGNDLYDYLDNLNQKYGYYNENNYRLTKQQLEQYAPLIAINPVNAICIYETFVYWRNGDCIRMPMLKIGGTEFIPSWGIMLSPFGVERNIGVRGILNKNYYFNLYTRIGDGVFQPEDDNIGIGMAMKRINYSGLLQGIRLDLWRQPSLWNANEINGLNISTEFSLSASNRFKLKLGYKTDGYVSGLQLYEGGYGSIIMTLL